MNERLPRGSVRELTYMQVADVAITYLDDPNFLLK